MSTICKLNPKVREDRTARRAMLRQAYIVRDRMVHQFGVGSEQETFASQLNTFLEFVIRSPWRTGKRKNELFQQVARELAHAQNTST